MNKRALIGKVLIAAALIIVFLGAIVYFTGALKLKFGKTTVDIQRDNSESQNDSGNIDTIIVNQNESDDVIIVDDDNSTNLFEDNNSYNSTNVTE